MKLRNDKVLVIGGSSGIGQGVAARLLQAGAIVTIAGRSEDRLAKAKQELGGVNVYTVAYDISDCDHHLDLFEQAEKLMGGLNAFVNAAAIGGATLTGRGYEPWDITPAEWDIMNNTNYKAAYFLMRNEIEFMRGKGIRGNILNFSSNAAIQDIIGSYGAAKMCIREWTHSFGKQYGHDGIIINGIAPGATFTPMIADYAFTIDQPYPRHAIERFIRVEEIAELAFYLMSDYGEIICGETVVADGGDNNVSDLPVYKK